MYVTKKLSEYRASPEAVSAVPPAGRWSGILVLQDEDYEANARTCFRACKDPYVQMDLPFPQDRRVTVEYTESVGNSRVTYCDAAFFVPVPGQPLAAGRYYVVIGSGKNKGKVSTCSATEDMTVCFCRCASDVKATPFCHSNIYQQVEITPYEVCGNHSGSHFRAKSVSPQGSPQLFLRRLGWRARTSTEPHCSLRDAPGMMESLRTEVPDITFLTTVAGRVASCSPPVVVGRWYTPFLFVREGMVPLKDQVRSSLFYEISLEHFWHVAFEAWYDVVGRSNTVKVNLEVPAERVLLGGKVPVILGEAEVVDGFKWFRLSDAHWESVGLSEAIVEEMRWEQQRAGWVDGERKVEREEVYHGETGSWRKFRYCVLVERFVVRRLDGTVILTWEFRHTDQTRCLWE